VWIIYLEGGSGKSARPSTLIGLDDYLDRGVDLKKPLPQDEVTVSEKDFFEKPVY